MLHTDSAPMQSEPVYTKDLRREGGCLLALLGPLFMALGLIVGLALMKLLGGSPRRIDWTSLPIVVAVILGVVGARALYVHLRLRKSQRVRQLVQRHCEGLYGVDLSGAVHVGISPGWATKSYDYDVDRDVGFLIIERHRVLYLGDRASFELDPEQIRGLEVSSYSDSDTVMVRYPRIDLVWQVCPKLGHEVLGIDLRGARSVSELWVNALDLSTELHALQGRRQEAGTTSSGAQHYPPTTFDARGLDRSEDRRSTVERCFLGVAHCLAWVPMWMYLATSHESPNRTMPMAGVAFLSSVGLNSLVRRTARQLAKRLERRFMQRWGIE